uniref:Uncharacterized protein n=1 Tax=Anguilla anguilla TaxID=7936 RepID=A0A0E9WBM1_ANGAN
MYDVLRCSVRVKFKMVFFNSGDSDYLLAMGLQIAVNEPSSFLGRSAEINL